MPGRPRVVRMPSDWWDSPAVAAYALGAGAQSGRTARKFTRNTLNEWGLGSLADYYTAYGDVARFDHSLLANVTWARHNLITDASFNEFHTILCTNVLSHFSLGLQEKVHGLLHDSLINSGFLILGKLESMMHWRMRNRFTRVQDRGGVYRKARS